MRRKNKLSAKDVDNLFIDRFYSACRFLKQDASWYFDKPYRYARRMMESAERINKQEHTEFKRELNKNKTNKGGK